MEEPETFAYLVLTCAWSPLLENELTDWYYGDIIEAFAEAEDQATEPVELWGAYWVRFADRVAPVQLTLGWDVRPRLLALFSECNIGPHFRQKYERGNEQDNILFFESLPPERYETPVETEHISNPADRIRFDAVIAATVERARRQERGVLFISGWGWYYDMSVWEAAEPVMRASGMVFTNRHG